MKIQMIASRHVPFFVYHHRTARTPETDNRNFILFYFFLFFLKKQYKMKIEHKEFNTQINNKQANNYGMNHAKYKFNIKYDANQQLNVIFLLLLFWKKKKRKAGWKIKCVENELVVCNQYQQIKWVKEKQWIEIR